MKKFKHSDNEEFGRRPRKEKKPRGGGRNYTQNFSQNYERDDEDIPISDDTAHLE